MRYITYQYVVETHDHLIDEYGGRKGILNSHTDPGQIGNRPSNKDLYEGDWKKRALRLSDRELKEWKYNDLNTVL